MHDRTGFFVFCSNKHEVTASELKLSLEQNAELKKELANKEKELKKLHKDAEVGFVLELHTILLFEPSHEPSHEKITISMYKNKDAGTAQLISTFFFRSIDSTNSLLHKFEISSL